MQIRLRIMIGYTNIRKQKLFKKLRLRHSIQERVLLHQMHMWRYLGKPGLLRDKKNWFWSDAARFARHLIRALSCNHTLVYPEIAFSLLAQFKKIYKYKRMEKAVLEKHCLFLHTTGFPDDVTIITTVDCVICVLA